MMTLLTGLFVLGAALVVIAFGLYLALFAGNPVGFLVTVAGVIAAGLLIPSIFSR